MKDEELFLQLLEGKDKYKVYIESDNVEFFSKEDLKKEQEKEDYVAKPYCFDNFSHYLLKRVFNALKIDSEIIEEE